MEILSARQLQQRPTALLLDAVGTLIHTAEPVASSYAQIAADHGIQVDPPRVATAFASLWKSNPGPPPSFPAPSPDDDLGWWRNLVEAVFIEADARPADWHRRFPACFERIFEWFGRGQAWRPYEDAIRALDRWQNRFRLIVVSNFDLRLQSIFEDLAMLDRFHAVVLSSRVGAPKPAPEIFRAAVERSGHPADECLHVGDDAVRDVGGASAAGLKVYRVHRPDSDLDQLADWLDHHPG